MKKKISESGADRLKRKGNKLVWVEVTPEQYQSIRHDALDAGLSAGRFLIDLWLKMRGKR